MNSQVANESNSTEQCSPFQSEEYVIVALVSAGSATISFLACIVVILLIMILKKYLFFVQRLILYLCFASLVNSFAILLRFQQIKDLLPQVDRKSDGLHILCVITAFIDQTSAWAQTIAICCITLNLLLNAVFKKDTEKLELFYIGFIAVFPLVLNWIPFLHNTYGEAGAWCWIRNTDEDCNRLEFGNYLQLFLWYVPSTILLVAVILVYFFIIIWVSRQRHKWAGRFDPETERKKEDIQKEVIPLLFYPLGYLIINIFPLVNRIQGFIAVDAPIYPLWILHAIISPLQGGYIALVYTLDKDTWRRLSCRRFKAALFHREPEVKEYQIHRSSLSDSWGPAGNDKDRLKVLEHADYESISIPSNKNKA